MAAVCLIGNAWRNTEQRLMILLAIERVGATTLLLTPEQIDEIGEFKYAEASKELVDECSICLSAFEPDDVCRELPDPCAHCFHKECIDSWFVKSSKCPLCNRSMYQIFSQRAEEQARIAAAAIAADQSIRNESAQISARDAELAMRS